MKKLNSKFIVSALLAAALVSMSAVSAGATDYVYADPHGGGTSGGGYIDSGSSSGGSSAGDVSDANEIPGANPEDALTSIPDDVMKEILATDNPVAVVYVEPNANGDIAITADAIGDIKNAGKPVVLINEETGVQITIDPDLIEEEKALNLGMDVIITATPEEIDGVEIPAKSIVIAPKQKGDFGLTLEIKIPGPSLMMLGVDVTNIHLYYIDDDGNVTDLSKGVSVGADGSVSFSITHASEYIITDTAMEADFVEEVTSSNDDLDEEDEQPSDYQIIIDIPVDEDDDDEVADETPINNTPDITVDEEDTSSSSNDTGKNDTPSSNEGGLIVDAGTDANPVTGNEIVFGTLAVTLASGLAIAATSKKRK